MKIKILTPLFITILLAGCSYTHYKTPQGGSLVNARAFWTTSSMDASISTNGTATLSTGASKTDSEGLGILLGTALKIATPKP